MIIISYDIIKNLVRAAQNVLGSRMRLSFMGHLTR